MKKLDKKIEVNKNKEDKPKLKKPSEIKKIIEKNRFAGYHKTKKRFIN